MTDGPFTVQYAKQLSEEEHIHTGGCWRCVQNANLNYHDKQTREAKTQWKESALKFVGHRAFCPEHYQEEMQGARDF